MEYSIGQVAEKLQISPSTLRYYDAEGLLPFLTRKPNGKRVFTERDIEILHVVEILKRSNMSIKDIRSFVSLVANGDRTIEKRLDFFRTQRESIRIQIEQLQKADDIMAYKCELYAAALRLNISPDEVPLEEISEPLQYVRAFLGC